MTDDFNLLEDPAFPDRPQHPDFWKLSEVVLYLDGQFSERGYGEDAVTNFDEFIAKHVDIEALTYMAKQRVLRSANVDFKSPDGRLRAIALATYIDAFLTGYYFAKRQAENG